MEGEDCAWREVGCLLLMIKNFVSRENGDGLQRSIEYITFNSGGEVEEVSVVAIMMFVMVRRGRGGGKGEVQKKN